MAWTKEQHKAYRKKWYAKNKEKVLAKNRLAKYGITEDQYNKLFDGQAGVCAICKTICDVRDNLAVDHCHETNKVRGLLCHHCNTGLGSFKDSQDLLQSAIEYLNGE